MHSFNKDLMQAVLPRCFTDGNEQGAGYKPLFSFITNVTEDVSVVLNSRFTVRALLRAVAV